jgi:membrane protease YdiL (CAAX protease family)
MAKKKKEISGTQKSDIEKSQMNKLKILDGMTAYIISLALFALAYVWGTEYIGVWALYIAAALSIGAVMVLTKITGLKFSSVFGFTSPKKSEIVGCALTLAAAFMISMPLILFSHLIAPNLAVTSFNIYSVVGEKGGTFVVILLTILLAVFENLLFDGYIYSRFKGIKNVLWRAFALSFMASLLRLDIYALATVFVMSLASFAVRKATDSLSLALVVRLFEVSFVMAMTNVSATSSELLGSSMGAVQVTGLSVIFLGIAIPALAGALGVFGKLKNNGKIIGFLSGVLSIVFIAMGCGISSL